AFRPRVGQRKTHGQNDRDERLVHVRQREDSGAALRASRRGQNARRDLCARCDGGTQKWGYKFAAEGLVQTGHVAILIRYFDRTKTPDKVQPDQQKEFSRWLKGEAQNDEASKHFDQWVTTVSDAVAYARSLDGVDVTRVGIAGFSFG